MAQSSHGTHLPRHAQICVCVCVCACSPSTLTQCVSWAQRLGGHAAVHGEVEWLLHFGPDNSTEKGDR